ncbi:hypothetical protein [Nocardioides plantarum]|uniref:Alpha-tubulin suppressor-like RCC1 family protein n=1 Tax=Nocardioides plantarum TaxID=29299 RepID=A0ABV5KCQ2_9ACTN|nr:hypothetical protein [Nocardioides plantarum]
MSLTVLPGSRARVLAGLLAGVLAVGAAAGPVHAEPSGFPVPSSGAGRLVAWGSDNTAVTTVPSTLAGRPVTAVVAGFELTLALTADGKVTGWGSESATAASVPASVNAKPVKQVAVAANNAGVVHTDGTVELWGNPAVIDGQPAGLTDAVALSMATASQAVLRSDGTVVAWGPGAAGSGDNVVPPGLTGVTALSSGLNFHIALLQDGTLTGWGRNTNGQTTVPAPPSGEKFVSVASGGSHSLALTDAGHVLSWGFNSAGQTSVPAELTAPGASPVVAIDANSNSSIAATADGHVYVWGASATSAAPPEALSGQPVVRVALGNNHAVALVTTIQAGGVPTIAGTPRVGSTLTATDPEFTQTPDSLTSQWLRDGTPIAGATGRSLTLTAALAGARISYRVTAVRGADQAVATSARTAPVTGSELSVRGSVRISGSAVAGKTLRATSTVVSTPAADRYAYQWLANSSPISGATATSYRVRSADRGKRITARVTAVKAGFPSRSVSSPATAAVVLPAAKLRVSATSRVKRGGTLKVKVAGLSAGETVVVKLGSTVIARGRASSSGAYSVAKRLSSSTKRGKVTVRATGVQANRTGTVSVSVV